MEPASEQKPRYRCLEDSFFPPILVPKGSIISTSITPGPHLEPINAAAHAAMEKFYAAEFTYKVKDPNGGEDIIRTYRPREELRLASIQQNAEPEDTSVEILAPPAKLSSTDRTLAEMGQRSNTDQRPGPVKVAPIPAEFLELGITLDKGGNSEVEVATIAKPSTTVQSSRGRA